MSRQVVIYSMCCFDIIPVRDIQIDGHGQTHLQYIFTNYVANFVYFVRPQNYEKETVAGQFFSLFCDQFTFIFLSSLILNCWNGSLLLARLPLRGATVKQSKQTPRDHIITNLYSTVICVHL